MTGVFFLLSCAPHCHISCKYHIALLPFALLLILEVAACRFLYALLAVTVGAFAGAVALIAVSFYWFNPAGVGDCSFNVFVMTLTILLTVGVTLGSLHPQVMLLQLCQVLGCANQP